MSSPVPPTTRGPVPAATGTAEDRALGLTPLAALGTIQSVLDVGCNDGCVPAFLARHGATFIRGVEREENGLAAARERFGAMPGVDARFDRLDLAAGRAALDATLGADPATFDLVLYLGVHHHLQRQMDEEALRTLVEGLVARTGRYLAVRTNDEHHEALAADLLARGMVECHAHPGNARVTPLRVYARDATTHLGLETPDLRSRHAAFAEVMALSDVLFLSIPKSGRTWARVLLQSYFSRATGEALSLAPRVMRATRLSPSVGFVADFYDFYQYRPGHPRILFGRELREHPLILLLRDPRDVVVSSWHFSRTRAAGAVASHAPGGTLEAFVASLVFGLERTAAYHRLLLDFHRAHRGPKLLLTYEGLLDRPEAEFRRLVEFLSRGPLDEAAFAGALSDASFDAMRSFEVEVSRGGRTREMGGRLGVEGWSGDVNDLKVRSGRSGTFADALPGHDVGRDFPVTAAVLRDAPDPVRLSDTSWAPGVRGDAALAVALRRAEALAARVAALEEKVAGLRRGIAMRDARLGRLPGTTADAS